MVVLVVFALFLSFFSYSSAQYCLCKPGSQAPDPYQKVINYACGNGADCGPIQPNGPCYQANDVQAICSYAANSYYQNEKSLGATCDFGGVASPSSSLPSDLPSGCTYPTSAGPASPTSSNGTGIPTSPPTGGFNSPPTGSGNSPPAGGGFNSPPGGFGSPPGGVNPVPDSSPGIFSPTALGPSSMTDPSLNHATSLLQISDYIVPLSLIVFSGLFILWG
ncbi:hypothetical protein RND81_07G177600 [Saponaria officinalis]|uniref:X8 domain-containing protein n=1 Tax=Saponaria officinalis TaxID=3572 RepID=A0AAW1JRT9_SAPOF